jgi:glycosidase
MNGDMLHSVTNYQAYKGMWSSLNDMNMFEIAHTLERHFNQMYVGKHLFNFVDNHDVNRVAGILKKPEHLRLVYALMFGIPGVPCLYYGSEWGVLGQKENGLDYGLRPFFEAPVSNDLTEYISRLAAVHKQEMALRHGTYQQCFLTNRQLIFQRAWQDQRVYIAVNADGHPYDAPCGAQWQTREARDLLTGQTHPAAGGFHLEPYSAYYYKEIGGKTR